MLRGEAHVNEHGQPVPNPAVGDYDYDELVVLDADAVANDNDDDRKKAIATTAAAAALHVASGSVGGGDDGRMARNHHLPDDGVDDASEAGTGAPDGLRHRHRRQGVPPPPPSSPGTRASRSFEDIYDMTTVRDGTQPLPSSLLQRGVKGSAAGHGNLGMPQISSDGELSPYPSVRSSPNSSSRRKALAASLPFKFADTWLGR